MPNQMNHEQCKTTLEIILNRFSMFQMEREYIALKRVLKTIEAVEKAEGLPEKYCPRVAERFVCEEGRYCPSERECVYVDLNKQLDSIAPAFVKLQREKEELEKFKKAFDPWIIIRPDKKEVLTSDKVLEYIESLQSQLAQARKEIQEINQQYKDIVSEKCIAPDEIHCTCVPALRQEIEELTNVGKASSEICEKQMYKIGELCQRVEELEKIRIWREKELQSQLSAMKQRASEVEIEKVVAEVLNLSELKKVIPNYPGFVKFLTELHDKLKDDAEKIGIRLSHAILGEGENKCVK